MATSEEKHNCFLLNFFKGSADSSSVPGSDAETEPTVSAGSEQAGSDQGRTENITDTAPDVDAVRDTAGEAGDPANG